MLRLVALVLLLTLPAAADDPCREDWCSDDPWGVLGNEELVWDATPRADYYELGVLQEDESVVVCESWIRATSYFLSGTPCDEANTGLGYKVRACNDAGCGPWSRETVEVLPYACLKAWGQECRQKAPDGHCLDEGWETECEEPCYHWQPGRDWRRLPQKYEECP